MSERNGVRRLTVDQFRILTEWRMITGRQSLLDRGFVPDLCTVEVLKFGGGEQLLITQSGYATLRVQPRFWKEISA